MAKILVLDDVEDIRSLLKEFLPMYGYEVEVCEKGEDVISLVKDEKFDVFLFDIANPLGMGGIQTLTKVLEIFPEAKVVAMSGDKLPNFKAFGFYAFWYKMDGIKLLLEALKGAGA